MKEPKYWTGLEELELPSEKGAKNGNEFAESLPIGENLEETTDESLSFSTNRRDFLKLFGFGITAATLAACTETPVKYAVPYVQKPDDVIPGIPNYYSSTCAITGDPVIVKTREGRPIKLEGNPGSKRTKGGLSATTHATILSLYDVERLEKPKMNGEYTDWDKLDKEVKGKIDALKANPQAKVRVLSNSIVSPSTLAVINDFLGGFGEGVGTHITYDAVSASAISQANEAMFGQKVVPSYRFDKADVIVSFSADFLGTWLSPVEFAANYAAKRDPKSEVMSRHFQLESNMTISGSKADVRLPIKASEEAQYLVKLHNQVAAALGKPSISGPSKDVAANYIGKIANELVAKAGKSLVVCGTNDVNSQMIVNSINHMLNNYGSTVHLDKPFYGRQGDDQAMEQLANELQAGQVDALFIMDANPVYDSPYGEMLAKALPNVGLSVIFTTKENETSEHCKYIAAQNHYLESWGDASVVKGHYSIVQPTINPIFKTRQAQDCLLRWSDNETKSYYGYLGKFWEENLYSQQSKFITFQGFWDNTLREGVFYPGAKTTEEGEEAATPTNVAMNEGVLSTIKVNGSGSDLDVVLYEKVGIRDGRLANNPWLQELPDPITRATWDNYVTVPVEYAKENGIRLGDVMTVEINGKTIELPAYPQPGQALGTIGVALGYGRTKAGRTADKVGGANVFPMAGMKGGALSYISSAKLSKAGKTYTIARTQKYDLLVDPVKEEMFPGYESDRSDFIIRETTLEEYKKNPSAGNEVREEIKKHLVTLWDAHFNDVESSKPIRWVMAIDMNKCTGCAACIVSCHAENNVPVVGKAEINNHREMHWLRIDRYYSGNQNNPDVIFQPMLCQHCDNAPCENVCPVLATVHSNEGLNQMAYNRCVGTRYCMNNCPYKVRRFNWFKYHDNPKHDYNMNNDLGKLALNPDVTVRFRGVMEKCSFCVQRLQAGKLKAKVRAGGDTFAKPQDGEVQTACQQSCPTGAIVFGDLNDKNSEVSKLFRDARNYHALEEVKTLPSVGYQTLVRNRTAADLVAMEKGEKKSHSEEGHEEASHG